MDEIPMKLSLFEHLNNLTVNKEPFDVEDEGQVKSYEPYMINRFVSMTKAYTLLVNEINKYDVPKNVHYEYYLSALPKRKQFFKYIKKNQKDEGEILKRLCLYYEIGKREAKQYLNLLSSEQVDEIYQKYETK